MNNLIILYSTGCPKCNILKEKLKSAKIIYAEVSDKDIMTANGIDVVPVLEIDGARVNFTAAMEWLYNKKRNGEQQNEK